MSLKVLCDIWTHGKRWRSRLSHWRNDAALPEQFRALCEEFIREQTTTRLDIGDDTGLNRNQITCLLDRLEELANLFPRGSGRLVARFTKDQIYVYGLCALAAWKSCTASDLVLEYESERTRNYIAQSGMLEALRDPLSNPVQFDKHNLLGFTRISPDAGFDTDRHAGRLVELFQRHINLAESTAQALATAFAEMIENTIKHGKILSPAWLFATYHPRYHNMHVCICDRGIGIQQSFLDSEQPDIHGIGLHPTDWIKKCTDPLITSKTKEHAGYGLYVVRELCRRNFGTFLVTVHTPS